MGKKNILKLLLIILCLCVVMLFALVAAGVNVPFLQTYKTNFKNNVSGISNALGIELPQDVQIYLADDSAPTPKPTMVPASETQDRPQQENETVEGTAGLTVKTTDTPVKTAKNEMLPVAFDGASNAKYADYGGDIVCVNETQYIGYNKKGEVLWDIPIQMQDPQVTVRGKYVLINETGAKNILLYNGKKKVFEAASHENIITADLSPKGDVVAVTEKTYYKGQVLVFNKSGEIIFAWASGSYNILDAAISSGRNVAISLLNTEAGANSIITCLDVNGKEKYKTGSFTNSVIFDLEFDGEKLNAIADNKCIGISAKGKTTWEYSFEGKTLMNYDVAQNGSKLFLLENGGLGEIVVVSAGGKSYDIIKTESMPDAVSIKSDFIAYNSGRDIIVTDFKGSGERRASCGADIKQIYAIAKDNIFCVYSSSIQVKKPVKVQ